MSKPTNATLWCWLLRGRNETERAADSHLVLALRKATALLGVKAEGDVEVNEGVVFDAFGLTITKGSNGANNALDEKGDGAGEVSWSLGHRPFVIMLYAKQEINRFYVPDKFGDPKLSVADESMMVTPVFASWSDIERYLTPFVVHGVDLEQARLDLVALGLIGSPMVFEIDDDDDDFILMTA